MTDIEIKLVELEKLVKKTRIATLELEITQLEFLRLARIFSKEINGNGDKEARLNQTDQG